MEEYRALEASDTPPCGIHCEEVKTKAGTFKAFRITHIQQRAHTSFSGDVEEAWQETLWYGPGLKAFVKREVNTNVEWGPDWELESYVPEVGSAKRSRALDVA